MENIGDKLHCFYTQRTSTQRTDAVAGLVCECSVRPLVRAKVEVCVCMRVFMSVHVWSVGACLVRKCLCAYWMRELKLNIIITNR